MIYNDGYEVDKNLKFVKCPRCGNEEYSRDAQYGCICGFLAYNECKGSPEVDDYGNIIDLHVHRNVGNARYCEFCGQPTALFTEMLLKPYTEVQFLQEEQEDEGFLHDTDMLAEKLESY